MVKEEIIEVYTSEDKINQIIEKFKKYKFDDFIKTDHFNYSLEEKNSDLNYIRDNFSKFHLIKIINKRKHKNGKVSYDLYYEMADGTYILYSISMEENKLYILNSYPVNRNFKKFRDSLIKAYKDKLID